MHALSIWYVKKGDVNQHIYIYIYIERGRVLPGCRGEVRECQFIKAHRTPLGNQHTYPFVEVDGVFSKTWSRIYGGGGNKYYAL